MISDLEAKSTASDWHGGQFSPLYALASTGAIVDGIVEEIDVIWRAPSMDDIDANVLNKLPRLLAYVRHNGLRGPQAGWSNLTW